MLRLAIVRGAGKRDFLIREAEMIGGPAFDHRQALEGLDRRARIHGRRDAALGGDHAARGVHHAEGAAMAAFDNIAPRHFGDHRVDHGAFSLWGDSIMYQTKPQSWAARNNPSAQL